MSGLRSPAPSTNTSATVHLNGRTYECRQGRSVGRWTYVPSNGHARVWVHSKSRLHHALTRIAELEAARTISTPEPG